MTLWEATAKGPVIVSLTPSLPTVIGEHLYRVRRTHPYYAECWPVHFCDGEWKVFSHAQKLTVPWDREVRVEEE